ncbi:hypothetical protein NGRA_0423 [Nosema granulosis]|uniref:Uncharacterized protein n=1 Tax=Nosema granulosis TaxID=83296 RepID=A0A9P6L0D0_9MICR|nr:hypothetical protein NGRA_0423 [Nosema granulosis]
MKRETVFETVVLRMLSASKTDVLRNPRQLDLLKSKQTCPCCNKEMGAKDLEDHIDGQACVCNNYQCNDYKTAIFVIQDSLFVDFRLSLQYLFLFIYCWASSNT